MKLVHIRTIGDTAYEMYEHEKEDPTPKDVIFWWITTASGGGWITTASGGGWTLESALHDFKFRTNWAHDCILPNVEYQKFWYTIERKSNEYGIISP